MLKVDERLAYEAFLSKQKLTFYRYHPNATTEWRVPPIVRSFRPYQTQEDLWRRYRRDNQAEYPALFGPRFGPGMKARVYRAWPSLARDHHLSLLLRERGYQVIRTEDLDERLGVDVLVVAGSQLIAVHAYVDTPRSREWRTRKLRRHAERIGVQVELPLDLATARRCGEVAVYSDADLRPLDLAVECA